MPLVTAHRAPLAEILRATPEFTAEEVGVALEIIDAALGGEAHYHIWVETSDEGGEGSDDARHVRGYVCFGPTPMTEGTYDLYWIVVNPAHKGKKIGRALVRHMEEELRKVNARLVRVETEGTAAYAATCAFYEALGYERIATIRDFYRVGNDLVIYGRYLSTLFP